MWWSYVSLSQISLWSSVSLRGDSATDEVIALAHLLTQAGGCQLSEVRTSPWSGGEVPGVERCELWIQFIRTQQRLVISLQRAWLVAAFWSPGPGHCWREDCLLPAVLGAFLISGLRQYFHQGQCFSTMTQLLAKTTHQPPRGPYVYFNKNDNHE